MHVQNTILILKALSTGNAVSIVSTTNDSHTGKKRFGATVRENRAVPNARGRPFTFIFSQYKSYPKRLTTMTFAEVGVRFNVENIYYFPSCSGGTISLHSRSLLNFPLDIWNPGGGGEGNSHMERQGMLVGKFEFNS